MAHIFPGWDKAPDGATHFCEDGVMFPWHKVVGGLISYFIPGGGWKKYGCQVRGARNVAESLIRPHLTAKIFYNSYAHQQLRAYVTALYADDTHDIRRRRLAELTKKFLLNYNNLATEAFDRGSPLSEDFQWNKTPEGFDFWDRVDEFRPEPRAVVREGGAQKEPNRGKEKPKQKVGWW